MLWTSLSVAILITRMSLERTLQAMSLELLRELLTALRYKAFKQRQFLHLPNMDFIILHLSW